MPAVPIVALFALEHDSLEEVSLAVALTPCEARLREVHDHEFILMAFFGVGDTKIEPLLVAFGVRIHLHVKSVFVGSESISTEQVSGLEHTIEQEHIAVMFLYQLVLV